jgi:hypothetical protein
MISKNILDIITKSKIEIYNPNKEEYPSVFYIGLGKTGSQSICSGFTDNKVAHWHSEIHFRNIYKVDISPLTLLDIVDYVSRIKPVLVIECIRDPISRALSILFQEFHMSRIDSNLSSNLDFIKQWVTNYLNDEKMFLYANNWKSYYDINILPEFNPQKQYFYTNLTNKSIQLLFLRYENIEQHKDIINNIGYSFINKYINKTCSRTKFKESYKQAKEQIKFSPNDLEKWYSSQQVVSFYTSKEIEHFITIHQE